MRMRERIGWVAATIAIVTMLSCLANAEGAKAISAAAAPGMRMPDVVEQFAADSISLGRAYSIPISPVRMARMEKFDSDELQSLAAMNFDDLSQQDKVDYLLLKNRVTADLHTLAIQRKQLEEMQPLLPFAATIEEFVENQRLMKRPDGERDAAALTEMVKRIAETTKKFDPKHTSVPSVQAGEKSAVHPFTPVTANRAVAATGQLSAAFKEWFNQYNGYDPEFTWWVDQPYKDAQKALSRYKTFLNEKLIGIASDDKTTIIGDPVGREALMNELDDAMIPYTPEELIAIAQTEYDWCMREMLKASREKGYGDDWHAAVEKVKQMHVPPGEQPELIRKLVVEGSEFAKSHDLVTVPSLASETWRMIMMTPERQLVNPFFTGGDEISVSYPTDTIPTSSAR